MRQLFFMLLATTIVISACKSSKSEMAATKATTPGVYGEAFKADKIMTYDDLLSKLNTEEKVENVVVEGKVAAVCQMKGCWMNIVSEKTTEAPEMFVKFKDYAFFMPLDLTGGKVVMKGNAFKELTSVEELRHYAEDEGKSAEQIAKITEPIVELKFMASGVKILN